ncbi:hypothetical protein ENTCAN_09632 [Enterobacter cancerogenus ATCC 35316]|nr:hypothetical protein ENTCAN_09632 [Enterobacter cancerogenus ATCC 35316]
MALYQRIKLICLCSFVNDCLRAVCASLTEKSTTIIGLLWQ